MITFVNTFNKGSKIYKGVYPILLGGAINCVGASNAQRAINFVPESCNCEAIGYSSTPLECGNIPNIYKCIDGTTLTCYGKCCTCEDIGLTTNTLSISTGNPCTDHIVDELVHVSCKGFMLPCYQPIIAPVIDWYPTGSVLTISLPMTNSDANPPIDESGLGHTPEIGTYSGYEYDTVDPIIQSVIKLPDALYAGYTPYHARWNFGMTNSWNTLADCSFVIESDVYLPAENVSTDFPWYINCIYGGGGPSSGCPQFGVGLLDGVAKLQMRDSGGTGNVVSSSEAFPLDEWVNVGVSFNATNGVTQLRMNNNIVAVNKCVTYAESGGWREYNLGSAEWNEWDTVPRTSFAHWWKGYICNFRLYK